MKKLIFISLLLFSTTFCWSSASVTGNVTTLANTIPTNVVVRFTLQNCRVTPRVIGQGVIVSLVQELRPTETGEISGFIWRNDEITCVSLNDSFYTVSIVLLQGGAQQTVKTMNTKIITSSVDLNSLAVITNLTPAPFIPLSIIGNPPANQNVVQPAGTQLKVVGDGFPISQIAASDAEHGLEVRDQTATKGWQWAQQASSGGQPAYSLILKSFDTGAGESENYIRCVHNGLTPGIGSCRWLAGLIDSDPASSIDFSTAIATSPIKATAIALPATCVAKTTLIIDQSGSGGQKLKVCNAAGTGWDLIGDGGGSSGVTTFNSRTGDILPVIGDYAALVETLQNKTIDSVNNTVISRSKLWYDAAGCGASSSAASLNTPASGGASSGCLNGVVNTDLSISYLSYVDASSTVATGQLRLPSDFSGASSSVDIVLQWYQDSSPTDPAQAVRWDVALTCVGPANDLDRAWNASSSITSPTAAQRIPIAVSYTTVTASNCDAGNILSFLVRRDGANGADTYTGSAKLLGAELTIVRTQ